jgi:superfamily I DNA/RNA helicase
MQPSKIHLQVNTNMHRTFPDWQEIDKLRPPLTPGEQALAKYFDQHLPAPWEIYVQPFLNGDRPDIVILNPNAGLMIFEVKDWNPALYHSELKVDRSNHKQYRQFYVTDGSNPQRIPSPLSQVERYRENLIELYLPNIGEKIDGNPKILQALRIGLYFHCMNTAQAKELVKVTKNYSPIFGNDWLDEEHLDKVVPDWNRQRTHFLDKKWVKDIRFWLMPPFHSTEQGENIRLTTEQKRHVDPSPGQHQRLKGVAGSGKTLVIAQRAANLAAEGKKVLVVTYNITLWHYIRDHISRARRSFGWERIEFTHFHGLCRNYLSENDIPWPRNEAGEVDYAAAPDLIIEKLSKGINANHRVYDAVLIDEGQDFEPDWYQVLCSFLSENDEVLFVADERQNVYQRDQLWTNSMKGTKFRGRWRELKESYRLPVPVIEKANHFAEVFMNSQGSEPIPAVYQMSLPGFDPHLVWRNMDSFYDCAQKSVEIFKFLTREKEQHPQDMIILLPTHEEGWIMLQRFMEAGISDVNHVFEDKDNSHHHKKSFWMGDGRLKMSTIHSFKGWELKNVILITPEDSCFRGESLDSLIYTAITRTRENLIVLNRNKKFNSYGDTWPQNWKRNNVKKVS